MKNGQIIAFVSGKGGAGKSVIIANLGALIAESGRKVLMVDCDFFTRGLTFYVIGDRLAKTGILDYLKGDETYKHVIGRLEREIKDFSRLSLLPASSRTTLYSVSDLDKNVHAKDISSLRKIYSDLRELLLRLAKGFDYVLVDTRSGVDPISLLPVVASEEFVLVVEEDKTSWRIGDLLMVEIEKLTDRVIVNKRKRSSAFKGFIINKVTEEIPDGFIQDYLERRVIEGKCLLQIPLEIAVPMAFKEDKLVIKESPSSTFSQKMRTLMMIVCGLPYKERREKGFMERVLMFYGSSEILLVMISFVLALTALTIRGFQGNVLSDVFYVSMVLFALGLATVGLLLRVLKSFRPSA